MRYCCFALFLLFSAPTFAQVAICLDRLTVALPTDDCSIIIHPSWVDAGSYVPSGMTKVSYVLNGPLGPGTHTVQLRVDAHRPDGTLFGRNTCWSTVDVRDKTHPEADCHDQTYYLVDPAQEITFNVDDLVTFSDNCSTTNETFRTSDVAGFGNIPFSASVSDPSGNTDNCTGTISIRDAEPQNYCNSVRNAHFEHIRNVRLTAAGNTINETTGNDGGYRHHFPEGDNVLYHGYNYTLNYEPGFRGGSTYHEYWSVYLDKNADGDFTDAGELIHRWNGYGGNSFTFSSPGTVWGWSRIRVVMSYGGYASSCGGGYGETEDISVYLRPAFIIIWPWMQPAVSAPLATSAQQRGNQPLVAAERPVEMPRVGETAVREAMLGGPTAVKVFPNPANAGARLTVTGLTTNSFALRDFRGRVLATYPVNDTVQHITLPTTLPAGIYLLGQQRIVVR